MGLGWYLSSSRKCSVEVEIELNTGNKDPCGQELHLNLGIIYMGLMYVCVLVVWFLPLQMFFWRFTVGSEKGMLWVQQMLLLLLQESWYEGISVKKSLGHWTVLLLVDRLHYLLYRNTVNTLHSQHWLKELVHWIARPTDTSAMQCCNEGVKWMQLPPQFQPRVMKEHWF